MAACDLIKLAYQQPAHNELKLKRTFLRIADLLFSLPYSSLSPNTTTATATTTPAIDNANKMERRSARNAAATAAAVASPAAPVVRVPGSRRNPPAVGSLDAAIQALLMLPGFAWEKELSW